MPLPRVKEVFRRDALAAGRDANAIRDWREVRAGRGWLFRVRLSERARADEESGAAFASNGRGNQDTRGGYPFAARKKVKDAKESSYRFEAGRHRYPPLVSWKLGPTQKCKGAEKSAQPSHSHISVHLRRIFA